MNLKFEAGQSSAGNLYILKFCVSTVNQFVNEIAMTDNLSKVLQSKFRIVNYLYSGKKDLLVKGILFFVNLIGLLKESSEGLLNNCY